MKKHFKLICTALIAVLAFGLCACNKESSDYVSEGSNLLAYPPTDVLDDIKYDVAAEMAKVDTDAEKALALLKYTTYNTLAASRYYYTADMECVSTKSLCYTMKSQYFYIREGTDNFKQIISNATEGSNAIISSIADTGTRRLRYGTHRMVHKASSTLYDSETETLSAVWNDELTEDRTVEVTADEEEKIQLYKRLDSTLDLDAPDEISSAVIEEKQDEDGNKYYLVTIETDLEVLNSNEYTMERLAEDQSSASDHAYTMYTLTFEIWDCGLVRSMTYDEHWTGKMLGMSLAIESERTYSFSYDMADCSMAVVLQDVGFVQYLTDEEKTRQAAEYAAVQEYLENN